MKKMIRPVASMVLIFCVSARVNGMQYHVAKGGKDANVGTAASPFLTIQKAADVAQPGDTVTVHEGVYRERVNPPRGGTSDSKRIIYQSAEGETVTIKGSEVITGWKKVKNDTWQVIVPNEFFGDFNPFTKLNHGEWYWTPRDGFDRHQASVYLDGHWLSESRDLDSVLLPAGKKPLWFSKADKKQTVIWAQFKGIDPNKELIEISARESVFYPSKPGMNYITVRGFAMRHAATPWSGAMSEQVGLVGTHWSKGWIIENNIISHSMNTGITLGRYSLAPYGIPTPTVSREGWEYSLSLAAEHGWSKETIGSHVVRNNHISHCEKNGLHGSLGGVFSVIENNTICYIGTEHWIAGEDLAALKLLASTDTLIRRNHIHDNIRGFWIDWMAQNVRISQNLFYRHETEEIYIEVNHGPYLVDNNIFMSPMSRHLSEGGAWVHNLFAGKLGTWPDPRSTPYFIPHTVKKVKYCQIRAGDDRFYNNMFVGNGGDPMLVTDDGKKVRTFSYGLRVYDQHYQLPQVGGNIYYNGAVPCSDETALIIDENPKCRVEEKGDEVYLHITLSPEQEKEATQLVTTKLLGKAQVPQQEFTNPDGTPLKIDTDYFGKTRDLKNPTPGPFEKPGSGKITLKIW